MFKFDESNPPRPIRIPATYLSSLLRERAKHCEKIIDGLETKLRETLADPERERAIRNALIATRAIQSEAEVLADFTVDTDFAFDEALDLVNKIKIEPDDDFVEGAIAKATDVLRQCDAKGHRHAGGAHLGMRIG